MVSIQNPYQYYRTARDVGGQGRVNALGTAGSATYQAGLHDLQPVLNNPVVKNVGRALPFVSAGFDAYGDSQTGTASGEGRLRNTVGSTLAGAADATFWTGARTLNPLMMAAGVALDGAGWVGDRVFEATTDDDGLDHNSQQYRSLKQWEASQARTNFNNNPTQENKVNLDKKTAEAQGVAYQPTANEATDLLNYYPNVAAAFGLKEFSDPNSAFNKAWEEKANRGALFNEQQSYRIKDRELRNNMIGASFDHRNNMAAKNVDAYWNDLNSSRDFIARLWG